MISTPAFFNWFAAAMASSWDFPSVNKTRKKGVPDLAPASALMFSSITWSRAWPERWTHRFTRTDRHVLYCLYLCVINCTLKRPMWGLSLKNMNTNSIDGAFTCKCVPSLISEIPDCLKQLVFSGEVVELPFCAGVSTVLGQTWDKNISLHKT